MGKRKLIFTQAQLPFCSQRRELYHLLLENNSILSTTQHIEIDLFLVGSVSKYLFFCFQRRLSVYSKMQECVEQQQQQQGGGGRGMLSRDQGLRQGPPPPGVDSSRRSTSDSELKDGTQPAEAEYLSSRCVLFTYFQGDIGDVVDEHFSRALSQSSTFNSESKPIRTTQASGSGTAGLWKGEPYRGKGSIKWSVKHKTWVLKSLWFCFRWVRLWGSGQLSVEHNLPTPGRLLPPIRLRLGPPGLLLQPRLLQPPGRISLGRPRALPGQPPSSGHPPRQLDLQPEPPEPERLPQRPQRLSPSPPPTHPHPAPPPNAPFIPDPQRSIGSQV